VEVALPALIGRDAACDLRLDADEYVSARHARLELAPDGVRVVDLGSTNGTYVNGERVARERLLRSGDVLRLGQTELRLER
jgi:pSer/pThr/pTyr-binding forkhead associated (FHA) protein